MGHIGGPANEARLISSIYEFIYDLEVFFNQRRLTTRQVQALQVRSETMDESIEFGGLVPLPICINPLVVLLLPFKGQPLWDVFRLEHGPPFEKYILTAASPATVTLQVTGVA